MTSKFADMFDPQNQDDECDPCDDCDMDCDECQYRKDEGYEDLDQHEQSELRHEEIRGSRCGWGDV
jgi:hypothetical protein